MNAFFNKYDKLIYIIQTFCCTESSHLGIIKNYSIDLYIFKNNKVKYIYNLRMERNNYILYENEISKGYDIIFIVYSGIKSIHLETIKKKTSVFYDFIKKILFYLFRL